MASTLALFFFLAASTLAFFFSLTSAFYFSSVSFLALARVFLSNKQYYSTFELLPNQLPDDGFNKKVLNDEFNKEFVLEKKNQ